MPDAYIEDCFGKALDEAIIVAALTALAFRDPKVYKSGPIASKFDGKTTSNINAGSDEWVEQARSLLARKGWKIRPTEVDMS